jgi:hypothetical protein
LMNLQELRKQQTWSTQKISKTWSWIKPKVRHNQHKTQSEKKKVIET